MPVKDRLASLKAAQGNTEDVENKIDDILQKMDHNPPEMQHFFSEIEDISSMISDLRGRVHELIINQKNNLRSLQPHSLIAEIKQKSLEVRSRLKEMEKRIEKEDRKREGQDISVAFLRMKKTQHYTLSRLFMDIMMQYNSIQIDDWKKCKVPPVGPQSEPTAGSSRTAFDTDRKEATHEGVDCDGCELGPIRGIRFKCLTCNDYDLCSKCIESTEHIRHIFVAFFHPEQKEEAMLAFKMYQQNVL